MSTNSPDMNLISLAEQVLDICRDTRVKSFRPSLNTANRGRGNGGMNSNKKESMATVVGNIFINDNFTTISGISVSQYLKNAMCVYAQPHTDIKKNSSDISVKIDALKLRGESLKEYDPETYLSIQEELERLSTQLSSINCSSENNKAIIARRALTIFSKDNQTSWDLFNAIQTILHQPVHQVSQEREKTNNSGAGNHSTFSSEPSQRKPPNDIPNHSRDTYYNRDVRYDQSERFKSDKSGGFDKTSRFKSTERGEYRESSFHRGNKQDDITQANKLSTDKKFVPPHLRKYINKSPNTDEPPLSNNKFSVLKEIENESKTYEKIEDFPALITSQSSTKNATPGWGAFNINKLKESPIPKIDHEKEKLQIEMKQTNKIKVVTDDEKNKTLFKLIQSKQKAKPKTLVLWDDDENFDGNFDEKFVDNNQIADDFNDNNNYDNSPIDDSDEDY